MLEDIVDIVASYLPNMLDYRSSSCSYALFTEDQEGVTCSDKLLTLICPIFYHLPLPNPLIVKTDKYVKYNGIVIITFYKIDYKKLFLGKLVPIWDFGERRTFIKRIKHPGFNTDNGVTLNVENIHEKIYEIFGKCEFADLQIYHL